MEKRSRRSSGMCWLAGMFSVLLAAVAANLFFASEPGLLDHAKRLARTGAWIPEYGGYFWESDQSALSFRLADYGVSAVSVDVTTESETPRITLSNDFMGSHAGIPSQWRLSPDGKLLVWRIDNVNTPLWVVSDLAGKRLKTWKQSPGSYSPLWLPGNRRWLEYTNSIVGLRPVIHILDGPDVLCAPITGPFTWPLGITPDERVVTFEWHPENARVTWYEYPIASKPAPAVCHSVAVPKAADNLLEAELSPKGDRIACFVHYSYLSPLERLLQRFLSAQIKPHQKIGLWVIQKNGSRVKLLGAEDGKTASGLLWTPDGRRISFYDHGMLFSVPAE
jgi:hypothetical protein